MTVRPPDAPPAAAPARRRFTVRGIVQGVGFRPFVHGLATELGLTGHVGNTAEGVVAEVEGPPGALRRFAVRLRAEAPPLAVVEAVDGQDLAATGGTGFTIAPSSGQGPARTLAAPDAATCDACLAELTDPADRRYRHPFVTCTHCGPRFTIVRALPYDRAQTTMAGFPMCPRCAAEYADPADRRFHAQPLCCHDCGPRLRLLAAAPDGPSAPPRPVPGDPVAGARRLLATGAIVAVKGLGGYHLVCDAGDERAVTALRRRKCRGDKPFALMARQLADVEGLVEIGAEERALLTGSVRPIVLLRRRPGGPAPGAPPVCAAVAPGSPDLGLMLPYTPLHHLLFGLPGDPPGPRLLVMTSGNVAGEPLVTDDADALSRLARLADAWLTHDRPIQVPCDDSVVRISDGEPLYLRRSRGCAPYPVPLPVPVRPALATGGDLKTVLCLGEGRRAWLSAHIGDMDDLATQQAFERAGAHLETLTGVRPRLLATDRHPGYRTGQWAARHTAGRPLVRVQHHHAHIAAAMAEHGLDGRQPVIGVAFDGTGYGDDGAIWGGEILLADYAGYRRFAQLGYVPLPGGDTAVRRPYRMALAHLHAAGLPWTPGLPPVDACPPDELRLLQRQLERDLNCAPTSSMGRLFDALASLTGICHHAGYEAQAATALEAAARTAGRDRGPGYTFALRTGAPAGGGAALVADPGPVLAAAVEDLRAGTGPERIAARFHTAVAGFVRRCCGLARERTGLATVALTGGVFANTLLAEAAARALRQDGFTVLRHRLVPPNDGGLALGQLLVAARRRGA
ncbi:hydrogenase maturation protein HypF [Streptomyces sp. NRRL F-4489]|uniref:carbamoyltransferase HypF n=1 Tax=Streptomyces sp. NRRL F-4489 TaxID=1609095 RepID=UPI00074984F2|nr:carbamoyltransferase HypF [Streptomyces sp. NRRL F-4489]KUL35039.1 hydrogenase maturation protein HypF [Streptomyces sp. NRRL F-4489]